MAETKSIQVSFATWKKLKQQSFDAGMTLGEYLTLLANEITQDTTPAQEVPQAKTPAPEKKKRSHTTLDITPTQKDYEQNNIPYTEEGGFDYE